MNDACISRGPNNKSALRWSKQMLYCFQPDVPRVKGNGVALM